MQRRRPFVWIAVVPALLAVLVFGLQQLARARSFQLAGPIVHRFETTERRVAVTFDDGPVAAIADSLIAIMQTRGVRGTFFVIGESLEREPESGRRLVRAGFELGNHTWSHDRMIFKSQRTIALEVSRTDSLIRMVGHRDPIYFRPPFGYKLFGLPWYLSRHGRTTVTWDVEPDSYPEVAASAAGIVDHVLTNVRPGSIILLHPWYPSRQTTLAALPVLLDSLQRRGYAVGTVSELLATGRR